MKPPVVVYLPRLLIALFIAFITSDEVHAQFGSNGQVHAFLPGPFTGTYGSFGLGIDYTINANPNYNAGILGTGVVLNPTIRKASSGTHPKFYTAEFVPYVVTGSGSTITRGYTVHILGAPLGATTNYALAVDSGLAYFGGNVGIGTTAPGIYKLAVNGGIHAKEVVIDQIGWPDFVFDERYRNAPLSEIEQHIKAKHHLPGLPSAQEVAKNGINVGQMQAVLLQKIEELTLHLIAIEKEQRALQAENRALRDKLDTLTVGSLPARSDSYRP